MRVTKDSQLARRRAAGALVCSQNRIRTLKEAGAWTESTLGQQLPRLPGVPSQWFRSVEGALNTIAGYEAMNIIRKGQIRWLPKGDIVGHTRFIKRTLGLAA